MGADPTIAAVMASLVLLVLWLRTNIALSILALTAGYVLSDIIADDIVSLVYSSSIRDTQLSFSSIVAVTVTLLPAALILFRFKNFQPGRFLVHLAPAIAFALLGTFLVLIQLPFEIQTDLRENSFIFEQFETFEVIITVGAIIIAIFDLMAHEKKLRRRQKRRHKKGGEA
ncbi:MAG: hypothetical protein R3313_01430 [Candidatus Saccharimonadales bacterium]|nr:hypothetical protein [Candidatus Saccharimonadales bacterium]